MTQLLRTLIKVWCSAFASLTYCYLVSFKIPKGKLRLVSFLPTFYILTILPANLTTVSFGGMTFLFLTMLANFKLLLFSFGQGPLSSHPSISFSHFIAIACFPVKMKNTSSQNSYPPPHQNKLQKHKHSDGPKSPLNYTVKVLVLALLCVIYEHIKQQNIYPKFMLTPYYLCFMYLGLELVIATVSTLVQTFLQDLEFEPQFNEPYLSTSVQNFWGKRWNLMMSNTIFILMATANWLFFPQLVLANTDRMDGDAEFRTFIKVWCSAFASLAYCYLVSFKIPEGKLRLVSLLPIFYILTILPANLTTVALGGMTAFFLSWLANFKLLLFSFGQGPLSSNPSISFSQFISIACFPIKIKNSENPFPQSKKPPSPHLEKPATNKNIETPSPKLSTKGPKSPLNYAVKVLVTGLLCVLYEYKQHIHPKVMLAYYCCFMYLGLELILAIVAALAKRFVGLEFEPQFNEPYLSTSLQDFWGKRWNLMVSNVLKPTVYDLVKQFSMKMLGSRLATLLAVFSTFVASGLIHEMIYYYLLRQTPTWEVTWFFILHGILVDLEIVVKKAMKDRWRLHPVASWAYTVFILLATGNWLFFPQLLRTNTDVRISIELLTLLDFCKGLARSIGFSSF
ncbi:hypothetical protein AQUCO_05400019v1 [Aquilegia coerulea]|uniref:Wax synthase domain-containing protein n=1 Tax=Aquilegia coerulea TaxID=218851 RepID=A0A2G5CH94_AQUCA|nr:hypothetical protein AQUCO_05400019v1 [Aquilegia coerulea]